MTFLSQKPFDLCKEDIRWVNDTLSAMTQEEKIAQLFCLVAYSDEEEYLDHLTKDLKVGGIMCRVMPAEQVVKAVTRIQSTAKIPMLIAANLEAGGGGAAKEGTQLGCQMAVAATDDVSNVAALGDICGKEGAALGINWSFSPVSDIDVNFRNPITNIRTYGSDPDKVREYALSYIKAIQRHGVAAAIKHFPGDGVDERDQHIVSSVNDLSPEEWEKTYGRIYRSAVDAGVKSVMVGHIMLPHYSKALAPDLADGDMLPASLAPELVTGLLRGKIGFNGLVVTDSTTMAGFAIAMERRLAVPMTIRAGCDMFLFTKNLEEDFQYMREGVENGIITPERLDEAVTRILGLKASLGLHKKSNIPTLETAKTVIGCPEHAATVVKCADESITLVKNTENVLPVTPEKYRRVLFYPLEADGSGKPGRANEKFMQKLTDAGFDVTLFVPKQGLEGMMASAEEVKNGYDLIVYSANIPTMSNQTVARIKWCQPMAANVPTFVSSVPTVFVSLSNPYHLLDVPRVKTYINAYGSSSVILDALVAKLTGKSPFKGKSPVDAFCGRWDTKL